MENMKAMTIQMPEETYLRMKAYLKRHGIKQKDFIDLVLRRALDQEASIADPDAHKE